MTDEGRFNQIKILFETPGEIFYGEISSDGVVSQDVADASDDFKWLIYRVQELEKGNRQLLETIGGLVKAVEIYSGKPVDVAMRDLIAFVEEVDKDD